MSEKFLPFWSSVWRASYATSSVLQPVGREAHAIA
jgi:hypothetical protein